MPSVNKVILIGNLTREPEIRQTNGGGMVTSFTLAMNRRYTNARQEIVDEPCFVDITAFQRNAEIIQQFVHKGDPIYIEGRLNYDTWVDKQTGVTRNKLTVVCENLQLLSRRPEGAQPMGPRPAGNYRQAAPVQRPSYGVPQQQGYAAPAARPQYAQPQEADYNQPAAAPQQYRSAAPMPSFQAPEPPQDVPQNDAPVDDVPF